MKKSFMTRALATGLSLAMALSLSVADTSIASAAAKKASVTSMMKVPSKSVTEGKKVTTYMNSTAAKKYRIKSHTESATAKKYISVVMTSNRKGLTITAKDGAVTAANLTKKGVNVKINFAPATSVAAVKKAAATKYVNLKVVVNAKPVEKLTMTAEATGAKKITVTFNKAVAQGATTVAVKKASATPTISATTWAADSKSCEIVLGTKMTEGTYTVTVTGADKDALTYDVTVKNEALTAFELVSDNLVATAELTTCASISYKAVNQYGEKMNVSNEPEITGTFGSYAKVGTAIAGTAAKSTMPTADRTGTAVFKDITSTLCIPGQVGTIVIVDTKTGVNLNATIKYQSKAVASNATVAGIYNEKTEKLIDGNMTVGDKVGNYYVLVDVKDQYENTMSIAAVSGSSVSLNPAAVLTDVTANGSYINDTTTGCKNVTVDGTEYIAIPLKSTNATNSSYINDAGTLSLTIVSSYKGVLATPSFTIDPMTVISSFSVSQDGTLTAGAKNKLVYEAIDVNGNAVTDYGKLNNLVTITEAYAGDNCYWSKKTDGTADLIYVPAAVVASNADSLTNTAVRTLTFGINKNTSSNYMVKTLVATVGQSTQVTKVSGITKDTQTACPITNSAITFDLKSLTYENQYSNASAYDKSGASLANVSAYVVDNEGIFSVVSAGGAYVARTSGAYTITKGTFSDAMNKIVFNPNTKKGSATLYLSYYNATANKNAASADNYDLKVTLSTTDIDTITYSDVVIDSINGGKPVPAAADNAQITFVKSDGSVANATTTSAAVTAVPVVVKANVNGKTVVIPTAYVSIITEKMNALGTVSSTNPARDETVTVKAVVQTGSESFTLTKDVVLSNKGASVAAIAERTSGTVVTKAGVTTGVAIDVDDLQLLANNVKVTDQYGAEYKDETAGLATGLTYKFTFTGDNADKVTVTQNGAKQGQTKITFKASGTYTATVTVSTTDGKISVDKDITITL